MLSSTSSWACRSEGIVGPVLLLALFPGSNDNSAVVLKSA